MKHPEALTARQEKVLTALLTEVTIEATAKASGVSTTTIWRYMNEPVFHAFYQQARRQVVTESVALLQRGSKQAVLTLIRNLKCGSPAVEVSAARVILEQSFRGVELLELEERIGQLERNMPEKEANRNGRGY